MVLVASGNYGNDAMIVVEDIYVDPETIAEEDEIVNNILTQYTSERYWDGGFQYPVDEPFINGYFGQRRNYNDGALYYYHTGIDFEVRAPNLNIYAPAAGEVVLVEEMVVRGNAILIDHGWGVYSGYWHLKEFNVEVGDFVQPGDLLGIIGDTGRSLGPHLHFEIDISGIPVNPETWLNQVFP
jgi:murein DD-endopeptidase MepM/ murein hydrolase activator NlpD